MDLIDNMPEQEKEHLRKTGLEKDQNWLALDYEHLIYILRQFYHAFFIALFLSFIKSGPTKFKKI